MADPEIPPSLLTRFWRSPALSWGFVCLGLGLFQAARIPPFIDQVTRFSQVPNAASLAPMGLLLLFSALPILGLWRLSGTLGVVRYLAFLFPFVPIATVAFYLVLSVVRRFRR